MQLFSMNSVVCGFILLNITLMKFFRIAECGCGSFGLIAKQPVVWLEDKLSAHSHSPVSYYNAILHWQMLSNLLKDMWGIQI